MMSETFRNNSVLLYYLGVEETDQQENTYLLWKVKYHCMANLQFDWFENLI